MSKMYRKLFFEWEKASGDNHNTIDLSKTLSQHVERLASMCCPGPFYYYVFDFANKNIAYMHPNFTEITGCLGNNKPPQVVLDLIHPDDINHFVNCERKGVLFYDKLMKRRKNKEYKISYQYRIKVKDGTYKLISHQVLIIDEDSQGQVLTTIGVHSDISHLVSNNNYKVSFLAIGDNKSYINLSPNDDSFESSSGNYSLTKRETEVIRLVSEGLSTKEIASYLYISTHTVTNHKTNSMKKLGVATINELVVTSLKSGIL